MKCPNCNQPMKQLFTGLYCDCERNPLEAEVMSQKSDLWFYYAGMFSNSNLDKKYLFPVWYKFYPECVKHKMLSLQELEIVKIFETCNGIKISIKLHITGAVMGFEWPYSHL